MQKISLVLFDMHDVLCRYDRAKRIDDLARLSGKPPEAIYRDIWQSGFEDDADAGKFDDAAYLQGFAQRLGYKITLEQWLANRLISTTPIPEVLDILAAVQVKVAVLTNNHRLVRAHIDVLWPELHALCGDQFYVSAQFGAAKPDPAAYLKCVAMAGAAPEETLFIDDSKANVDGALKAGLAGYVFTGAAALRTVLEGYNVI